MRYCPSIASPDRDTDLADPPGRREQNKADKQRRIIEAAARLFQERGFQATTTAAIAEAANIGAGTLYLYVNSKEDLLVDVLHNDVGRIWDEALDLIDADDPLLDQLLTAYLHVTRHHEGDQGLARAYFKELLFVSDPVREGVTEFMRGFLARFGRLIDEAKQRGKVDPTVAVMPLNNNLFAAWYLIMQRRHTGSITAEAAEANLRASFATALHGLCPPGPGSTEGLDDRRQAVGDPAQLRP